MSESVFLCPSDQVAEGQYREIEIQHQGEPLWLILTRREGQTRAWHNVCPHQGRPLNFAPDRFLTDKHNQLVCCHHGAVFEPDGGICVSGPCERAELKGVEVSESEGQIHASL